MIFSEWPLIDMLVSRTANGISDRLRCVELVWVELTISDSNVQRLRALKGVDLSLTFQDRNRDRVRVI
jgi:hypothetical protein